MSGVMQIPLKFLAAPVKNLNADLSETNLLSLSYGRIVRKDIASNEGLLPESFNGYNIVRKGDVVLRLTDMQNDQRSLRSGLALEQGIITSAYLTLRPHARIDPRYLAYSMHALDTSKRLYALGGGLRQSLTFEELGAVPVAVPPLEEQRRIADFLDDQVARIDAGLNARSYLAEITTRELDSAWTSQALQASSRGPSIPLRRILKSICDGPFGSSLTSAHYVDEGTRVVRLGNIGIDCFKGQDEAYIDNKYAEQLSNHQVDPGDLLMAGLGDETWPLGRCALAPEDLGRAIVKADCYRIRLDERVLHRYASWYLSSPPSRSQFRLLARGSTRARLNTDIAKDAVLPILSLADQRDLTKEFEYWRTESERQISRQSLLINLLQEYKRSLISAAVSGEFDVSVASGLGVSV